MGKNRVDETGKRFGRLIVLESAHKNKWGNLYWRCLCDCGKEKMILGKSLRNGDTLSCGCYCADIHRARATHGMARRGEVKGMYQSWANAKHRCSNPNAKAYPRYGGRGIKVCARWQTFENFKEDMEEGWSPGMTIDRIDSNGNYEPGNCQWLTLEENGRKGNK